MYSAPLKEIAYEALPSSSLENCCFEFTWRDLSLAKRMDCHDESHGEIFGRIRVAVLLSTIDGIKKDKNDKKHAKGAGYIQISPTREGPWTTVRLNYASPAACWRLGNDIVASEVSVKDGNRNVIIRSLVSVANNTDFVIDLRLKSKRPVESLNFTGEEHDEGNVGTDYSRSHTAEFFETENYSPSVGWVRCSPPLPSSNPSAIRCIKEDYQKMPSDLPDGWEWVDEWHVDTAIVKTSDGWVYAPSAEHLKWPKSSDHIPSVNYARQRRWIRNRKYTSHDTNNVIPVGLLEPGHTIPLPLSGLLDSVASNVLQLRPKYNEQIEYSWSSVIVKHVLSGSVDTPEDSEICVSALVEADELLHCSEISSPSSNKGQGLWFCLSIRATQIGKDIHSDPIHDWKLTISSPLSIINFLPLTAEYSVMCKPGGECSSCSQGNLLPGKSVKICNADVRDLLYLSVCPLGGWELIHEPVPMSNPSKSFSKTMNLRNSSSGRIVMIILEQNFDKDHLIARTVRIYVPYWIASARCPPLIYKFTEQITRREKKRFSILSNSNVRPEKILSQITDEEMSSGYTIASALNFKYLGLSVSLRNPGKVQYGPIKDLSPLCDMDGSVDLDAYDTDGNCMRIFVSSKPCLYEAVPTKVVFVRPFIIFTNRLGQDAFIRFNADDQPKILLAYDSRVPFVYQKSGPEKIQVRLQDTSWCFPLEIRKEDSVTILLKKQHGRRTYLRAEIRGYEEGSRFLVVLRVEPAHGPIRVENRMADKAIRIHQSGFSDDASVYLEPLSTSNFSWDDPYGQRLIDVFIDDRAFIPNISLEEANDSTALKAHGVKLCTEEFGDIKIVRFLNDKKLLLLGSNKMTGPTAVDRTETSSSKEMKANISPLDLIIELGIVGVSLIDHRPRELLYLYLERFFVSYSTGYDAGKTSRLKLIVGGLQLDNQLPLTIMPVLLAPDEMLDLSHSVFKATITLSNENIDGTLVFPYVYVRVTDKCWRINIHEPVVWALIDFYNNLRLDTIPSDSGVTEVDPEIRIDLIDVSEIKLKVCLETEPDQRPPGALGIWGPIFSAVGNAFKLQLHLRKVVHKNRFMRKSFILPAIVNRIKRDLIHNPLHIIFSVDVLGMTKSTLSSLSKGFAELSTDQQFLQLRSKQVWSRRITGFGDGFLQGTEAFVQGVAFGVTGVLRKPVENARQNGVIGLAHGLGRAFVGFVVQPLSGALDFFSLTVDGIGASFAKCMQILNNKAVAQRMRNPRSIHADGVLRKYSQREAVGQMILYLAEASRHLSCADLFKEPAKYAWSDFYEDHFIVPYQRIVLITNKRVMLLQSLSLENLDKRPSKIIWDVPWEELLALELAKAGHSKPSHLIIHLKYFRMSESFVRVVRCNVDEEGQEPQAVMICACIRRMWKAHQSDFKVLTLKVPSSQRYVQFTCEETDGRDSYKRSKPVISQRGSPSAASLSHDMRFKKHSVNFQKIWSSEQEHKSRCTLFPKQVIDDGAICSIWRPLCPDGYISVGDVAHIGDHPPHVAAIYRESHESFSIPVGYDLVWRNCAGDYTSPVSIWLPRPPDGFVAIGCVAVAAFEEPSLDSAYCVSTELVVDSVFEEQMVWTAPDSHPWSCNIYQVQSEALHFIALRQPKEESDWSPMKVSDRQPQLELLEASKES
ncbi:hypothetical protein AXF42_Ash010028 [Apostasia shenzhenica]|uniref:Peroxin/Ferlin domain-containing protein n=1 Tax=Apostasia shenzhenica TaxID=1088818 RepID=A0A2I0ACM1_9ASPA|nr:hypothetical protein AXF42_Ash010028 [Apostasia shenzhenica]